MFPKRTLYRAGWPLPNSNDPAESLFSFLCAVFASWNGVSVVTVWLLALLLHTSVQAQTTVGLLNDDFSTGSSHGWTTPVAGASTQLVNGQLVLTMAVQNASLGYYRGDFRKTGGATLHAGSYPIVAVKFNKPPRANFFLDTSLGAYNNGNNNATKIETATGNVYYWDLSTGKLGTTTLSGTQPTTLSLFQFKLAEITRTQAEIAAQDFSFEIDWVKTFRSVDELRTYAAPVGSPYPVFEYAGQFVHPGLMHSAADLARVKNLVTNRVGRPYQSYQLLAASNKASATYTMAGPFRQLTRDASLTIATPTGTASGGAVKNGVESDFMAAYYNALMWNITGNVAHAQKSAAIINAYANYTTGIVGVDAELNGLYGFMLANAAELLRGTYPGWSSAEVQQCQTMLRNVFYPTLRNFRPCAHGNWDIVCMKALMAIAIFSDDNAMYNRVVNYYYNGEGNGSINRYVLTAAGQLQESNRDQPHTMLAIGSLAEIAEMALKQGTDLYSASNNAIMRGYEYTSQYNLGYSVPYETRYDYCERNYTDYTPEAISANGRGQFRAVFELAYNHYVFRKNKSMPYSLEVLGRTGPEGAPFGADNPGYGSLFFYLNSQPDYTFPGGVIGPEVGLINDNFTNTTDGWQAATTGSTAVADTSQLTVTIVTPAGGRGRADIRRPNTTLYPTNYPILAIKMRKPVAVNMTLDTNLGSYGNGANKWTGKVGSDIYYYDLRSGFGPGPTFLSSTAPAALATFQFKIADITSGETSYTVDWVKTVKNVTELLAYDPTTGLVDDNFSTGPDGWAGATTGSSVTAVDGQLRATLVTQANGKGRGDIKRTAGVTLYPTNYPILAVKLKNPATVNLTLDTNLGAFGNGSNKWTGKAGDYIYYFDLRQTGFGANNTLLTDPTILTLFQLKVADVASGETGYQVDWVKTVKSVADLNDLIAPDYQNLVFPALATRKANEPDFTPATSSAGLAVSLQSSNPQVATIVGGQVHLVGTGTTQLTATQPGSSAYYPAEPVTRTLTVEQAEQQLTFRAVGDQPYGTGPLTLTIRATATSGLPVSYTVVSGPATVTDSTLTVTDLGQVVLRASQAGNSVYLPAADAEQRFLVQDVTAPTVRVQPVTLALGPDGTALLTPTMANNGSTDNYSRPENLTLTLSQTSFSCADLSSTGTSYHTVQLTVADENGNRASASVAVALTGSVSAPVIQVSPQSVYVGTIPTLYLGYGPQQLTLTASGGQSYSWSPATNLSSTTSAAPVFTPTAEGSYTYTVTATSSTGCMSTSFITIVVEDVRCGNNSKVQVCHNGSLICVAPSAVNAHLNHGDQLGNCTTAARGTATGAASGTTQLTSTFGAYPNPFTETSTVFFQAEQTAAAQLQVFNSFGLPVATLFKGNVQAGQRYEAVFQGRGLTPGIYSCLLRIGSKLYTQRLMMAE